jgi:hypothetical protein
MSHSNYRIVPEDNGGFGVYEVHYKDIGEPYAITTNPVAPRCSANLNPDTYAFERKTTVQWPGKVSLGRNSYPRAGFRGKGGKRVHVVSPMHDLAIFDGYN